ncbi:hypothetical protein AXF42_Ash007857 [Apostasia shenzhenica]|uniref:Uncharacterized protein n=1 Tax=Apostasia shenzhenica TaxID=1088818 RepID=A0A2I0B5L1_9ASPA|nr:hypothetical protein AXF42_Ash007857 [Apostasia shenzhenica]
MLARLLAFCSCRADLASPRLATPRSASPSRAAPRLPVVQRRARPADLSAHVSDPHGRLAARLPASSTSLALADSSRTISRSSSRYLRS